MHAVPDTGRVTFAAEKIQSNKPACNRLDSSFVSWSAAEEAQHVLLLGQPNATFNGAVLGWRRVPTMHPRGAASPAAFRKKRLDQRSCPLGWQRLPMSGRLHELCETLFVVCMWPGGGGRGARLERPRVGASGPRGINASRLAFSRLAASFSHTVAEAATYLARFLGFYSASMSIREASPSTHVVSPQTIRLVPTGKPQAAAICLYA